MKYEKIEAKKVNPTKDSYVTVTKMGNTTELQYMSFYNTEAKIKKLSESEYVVVETGEIKPFEKKAETRADSSNSLKKTMKRIRELVTTNITDPRKVRWCTLTYKENVTDPHRLYQDFRKFNQRFRYYLNRQGIETPEYIAVGEPQLRGAWHLHIIYIWKDNPAPFIKNEVFSSIWGHGFTSIKAVKDDNISSYLCAYLCDLELNEEMLAYFPEHTQTIKTVTDLHGKEKRIAKGMRMYLYPPKFNIIRHSKGIKKPEKTMMTYGEALALVKGQTLKYETAYHLSDEKGFSTFIKKQEFKACPCNQTRRSSDKKSLKEEAECQIKK